MRIRMITALLAVCLITVQAFSQKTYQVSLPGSKGTLKAVVHIPKLKSGVRCPFVVVMHGFTGNKNEKMLIQISEGLQSRGIGSVRFDFNGHGESDGQFEDMTIGNEIADCKAVIETVKKIPGVDPRRIGLLGHSQGGVVTGMVAGELGDKQIKAIVQLSPAGNIGDDARKGKLLGTRFDVANLPATHDVWNHKVGRDYLKYAINCDMYGTAAKYKGAACVIHGSADKAVPCEYGKRFADGYANAKWVLQPGDDHGLSKHRPQTLHTIYSFFSKNL